MPERKRDRRWRGARQLLLIAALILPPAIFAVEPDDEVGERLLALSPHLAELTCAAGACDRLVARVAYSDYPPAIDALPEIGNAFSLSAEAVVAAGPDRVFAWRGGTPAELVARLEAIGLRVDWIAIRGLDGIGDAIDRIGELAGTEATAHAASAAFRQRLAALRVRYADRAAVRVLYQIELQPMFTISRRSPIHDAITACGGTNVFADLPAVAASVTAEAAVAALPDVVVHAEQDDGQRIRDWWQQFPAVPAVAGGHVYSVDADLLSRATPRMLDGTAELCERIDRVRRARSSAS